MNITISQDFVLFGLIWWSIILYDRWFRGWYSKLTLLVSYLKHGITVDMMSDPLLNYVAIVGTQLCLDVIYVREYVFGEPRQWDAEFVTAEIIMVLLFDVLLYLCPYFYWVACARLVAAVQSLIRLLLVIIVIYVGAQNYDRCMDQWRAYEHADMYGWTSEDEDCYSPLCSKYALLGGAFADRPLWTGAAFSLSSIVAIAFALW
jgi:hypothetical protein